MLRMFAAFALFLAVARAAEEAGDQAGFLPWTYGKGVGGVLPPQKWSEKYPECGGKRQSPILLSAQTTSECKTDSSSWYFVSGGCTLGNAKAKGRPSNWLRRVVHALLTRTGEVAFEGCKPQLKVRGRACAGSAHTSSTTHCSTCAHAAGDKTYNLLQIHFHSSAEHLMSGYDFAAEAHFVHVNENDPNDLK
eukprot:11973-Heterococcus_DN1.PRE.1